MMSTTCTFCVCVCVFAFLVRWCDGQRVGQASAANPGIARAADKVRQRLEPVVSSSSMTIRLSHSLVSLSLRLISVLSVWLNTQWVAATQLLPTPRFLFAPLSPSTCRICVRPEGCGWFVCLGNKCCDKHTDCCGFHPHAPLYIQRAVLSRRRHYETSHTRHHSNQGVRVVTTAFWHRTHPCIGLWGAKRDIFYDFLSVL